MAENLGHVSFVSVFYSWQPVVLEWYRSLPEKKELLSEAISTHDGNTIITVVLFIQKTLSKGRDGVMEGWSWAVGRKVRVEGIRDVRWVDVEFQSYPKVMEEK